MYGMFAVGSGRRHHPGPQSAGRRREHDGEEGAELVWREGRWTIVVGYGVRADAKKVERDRLVPMLRTVSTFGALEVPTAWWAKSRSPGETEMVGVWLTVVDVRCVAACCGAVAPR